jgi:CheY-like chemotaxis protein
MGPIVGSRRCPRQDSNLRTRLRRPALYPLSYGGPRPLPPTAPRRTRESSNRLRRAPGLLGMLPSVSPRVLLVDDDPVILRLLEVNFRLDGFEVTTASHGDEAIARAAEIRPDAIVLDVMMPGADGYEVAHRIRADDHLAGTRLVFLTARTQDDERLRALGLLDVDRVPKPFDPIALVALVRERVGSAA